MPTMLYTKPMKSQENKLRLALQKTHQNLYQLGFGIANDGNSSTRLDHNTILITPAGLDKATLKVADFVVIDASGKKHKGKHEASSEYQMHVEVLKLRQDITSVVHTHAPYSIALSMSGISLMDAYLPEVSIALGNVPTVPYETTGTFALAQRVAQAMQHANVALLERHGVIAVGQSPSQALERIERMEHSAKIVCTLASIKKPRPLPQKERARLLALGRKLGAHTSV